VIEIARGHDGSNDGGLGLSVRRASRSMQYQSHPPCCSKRCIKSLAVPWIGTVKAVSALVTV
jgi:hypothetical protein